MTRFGLASTTFRSRRFGAKEIAETAGAGFFHLDVSILPGHVDLTDATQLDEIVRSAAAAGVTIGSLSVPAASLVSSVPVALNHGWPMLIARLGPCRVAGSPSAPGAGLVALLEKVALLLPDRGCAIALQGPGGPQLGAEALLRVLESLDDLRFGVCLDTGHAHLAGGAPECAETLSGVLMTTLLHDNNGREDSHRAPGEGGIDWPATITACWKTGFGGPWVIDVAGDGGRADPVTRAIGARTRLQAILEDLAQPMTFTE